MAGLHLQQGGMRACGSWLLTRQPYNGWITFNKSLIDTYLNRPYIYGELTMGKRSTEAKSCAVKIPFIPPLKDATSVRAGRSYSRTRMSEICHDNAGIFPSTKKRQPHNIESHVCEISGRTIASRVGMHGHMRTHQWKNENRQIG